MNAGGLLERLIVALDSAGIPYMLTGSYASSLYGVPRATQDLDLVVEPSTAQLLRFVSSLPDSEYYVDLPAALDALNRRSQFNVIDFETGWKIDLIVRKERPFSVIEFERREQEVVGGRPMWVATAEDVVLAKLEWAKAGGSLRQIEDAAGILKLRDNLDSAYLDHWIRELQIDREWQAALTIADRGPAAD